MKNEYNTRDQYLTTIVEALGLEVATFWEAVVRKEQYAITLYLWIDKLYTKDISTVVAKCLIFKARNMYYYKKIRERYA